MAPSPTDARAFMRGRTPKIACVCHSGMKTNCDAIHGVVPFQHLEEEGLEPSEKLPHSLLCEEWVDVSYETDVRWTAYAESH